MKGIGVFKGATKVAVGVGVNHVLDQIIKNNTASNVNPVVKGCVIAARIVVSGMVSDKVVEYTGEIIDEMVQAVKTGFENGKRMTEQKTTSDDIVDVDEEVINSAAGI